MILYPSCSNTEATIEMEKTNPSQINLIASIIFNCVLQKEKQIKSRTLIDSKAGAITPIFAKHKTV